MLVGMIIRHLNQRRVTLFKQTFDCRGYPGHHDDHQQQHHYSGRMTAVGWVAVSSLAPPPPALYLIPDTEFIRKTTNYAMDMRNFTTIIYTDVHAAEEGSRTGREADRVLTRGA